MDDKPQIVPSIVIGIGGTGCDVVGELKRRVQNVHGDLPIIQYLAFDTDFKPKDNSVLEDSEFNQLTVENADDYIQGISDGYYPEMSAWWPDELKVVGDLAEGAKQVRALGRFALFKNIEYVRNAINNRINYIKSAQLKDDIEKRGYTVKRDFKVYIINSLGGGTGSGMFIDLAFNIRDIMKKGTINGYTILPEVFKISERDRHGISANAYAALMELDYYMDDTSGHFFSCRYNDLVEVSSRIRPFDYYYIIDAESEDNFSNIKYQDSVHLISNAIFLDLTSSVGLATDSAKTNIDSVLSQHIKIEKDGTRFAKAYGSLGSYSLYYPASEIKNVCTNRYAINLMEEILKRPENTKEMIDGSFHDIMTSSKTKLEISDLLNKLYKDKYTRPSQIDTIGEIKEEELINKLNDWNTKELKVINDEIALKIKAKRGEFFTDIQSYLQQELKAIVDNGSKGLAIGHILADKFDSYISAHIDTLSGTGNNLGKIEELKSELEQLDSECKITLSDLENIVSSKLVLFKGDKIKKHKERYINDCIEIYNKTMDLMKLKEIEILYTDLRTTISAVSGDISEIYRKLNNIQKSISINEEKLKHHLFEERGSFQLEKWVGGQEDEVDHFYEKYENALKDVRIMICQNRLYSYKDMSSDVICSEILDASAKQYTNLEIGIVEAITNVEATIKKIIGELNVHMTYTGQNKGFDPTHLPQINIMGMPKNLLKSANDSIAELPYSDDIRLVATKDSTRISDIIYKYGIPLMAMEPVTKLKSSYEVVIKNEEKPLHIFKIPDIPDIL